MFDRLFRIFLAILPWSVLFTVFFGSKLGIPGVNYFKEIFLVALAGILLWDMFKTRKLPKFDFLDYSIVAYIVYLVVITLANGL